MLNVLINGYPSTLTIDDQTYEIDTDFRTWIGINEAMLDVSMNAKVRLYLMLQIFKKEIPRDFEKMMKAIAYFIKGNSIDKEGGGAHRKSRYVFSFTYDVDYIIGAFQECYGIDLIRVEYLHWWHFLALLNALNSQCELKQRIYYRSVKLSDIKDKKERNRIRKIQKAIALPSFELSEEAIAEAFS